MSAAHVEAGHVEMVKPLVPIGRMGTIEDILNDVLAAFQPCPIFGTGSTIRVRLRSGSCYMKLNVSSVGGFYAARFAPRRPAGATRRFS
jgi:hypothetical protein